MTKGRRTLHKQGVTRYHGKPCKYGHGTERFTTNGVCVTCHKERSKAWRASNPKQKVRILRNSKRHYEANKARYVERTVRRRVREKLATPVWANIDAMVKFYEQAAYLSAKTGVLHHVDHIIPLQGGNVCGLHVETNLQVLPWAVNVAKGNKILDTDSRSML